MKRVYLFLISFGVILGLNSCAGGWILTEERVVPCHTIDFYPYTPRPSHFIHPGYHNRPLQPFHPTPPPGGKNNLHQRQPTFNRR